ncbi:MAG TPA: SAF domain-containing protein [Magnetospirillum sp.]|jgi:predicted homoserine dehydrogenase-like protein|nr:SAF domain-containing protein [Magnetospirillum sp.]
MNLSVLLAERAAAGKPVRIGLIGGGKVGCQFLAQARHTPGMHVVAVADTDPERGPTALALAKWPPAKAVARSLADALETGGTWVASDPMALFERPGLDVVIEATSKARNGVIHGLAAIDSGINLIMVNLAADALAGPLLAEKARAKGLVYSLGYGDQPALICELVDWARTCGFEVATAGRGARWRPGYQNTTPDTVWRHWGITPDRARALDMSPRTFTAFIDGTRAAQELASVANATGLSAPAAGLSIPPCGAHDLARILKPSWDGGYMDNMGQVEAVSSLERDGRTVAGDLRWGVFVTFRAPAEYASLNFAEYGIATDDGGDYAARWRPHHFVGMELGVSVASVGLYGSATGSPRSFKADVVAVAKTDLKAGAELDGAGGSTVWGKLAPARDSLQQGWLPIGLTDGVPLARPVTAGQVLTWADVHLAPDDPLVAVRREMEAAAKA